ncbi:MAG: hypothetical protein QW054_04820 [Candidatus Micrarchaeia archaeon]
MGIFGYPWKLGNEKWPEELDLGGKKVLSYLLEKVSDISDEVIVVASSQSQASLIQEIMESEGFFEAKDFILDSSGNVLEMTIKLIQSAKGEKILVVPSSSPFLPTEVIMLLLDLLEGRDGVFLRDKLGNLYKRLFSLRKETSLEAITFEKEVNRDLKDIPIKLKKTMAISWNAVSSLDPLHLSYFLIATEEDYFSAKKLLSKVKKGFE